ncbi:MAG: phosphoglucomutase [Alkalispirochaeta sp.]
MEVSPSASDDHAQRLDALSRMILSASGWRTVFGGSDDDLTPSISSALRDLVAVAADLYVRSIPAPDPASSATAGARPIRVVVATDSRPTGPAIADTVLRTCLSHGVDVRWLGITPTPEALAYVATDPEIDGFFYITASHNPPGHNGFKMGYADGSVMPGSQAWPLIESFKEAVADRAYVDRLIAQIGAVRPQHLDAVEAGQAQYRVHARTAYRAFAVDCSAGGLPRDRFMVEMKRRINHRPLGIVGELNGSARSTSIDRTLLPELGVALALYNDTPGHFSHQILPEGAGLEEAGRLLEVHGAQDAAFQIAYVPDNDGDRGNLVFLNRGSAVTLDAQTVFALVVMTELAWTRYLERERGETYGPLAVVANGPTSSRIDEICKGFGARLYRAEVGEANVVTLAESLRRQGVHVVVLGEGSNGGNITPPSTVRDPLSTLLAMGKLHAFSLSAAATKSDEAAEAAATEHTDFVEVARSLPVYSTLPTDDPRAKMQIGTVTHADLKRHYERLLPDHLPGILSQLSAEYGAPLTWQIYNYEGAEHRRGAGARTGEERGGLKVAFYLGEADTGVRDGAGLAARPIPVAFVWMRGSGTEPVFRILADCRGDNQELLGELVTWQRDLVSAAVAAAQ